MNNHVTVGDSNSGNVAGGDLLINQTMPCKNGDGMLSLEDYRRMPYCNACIGVSRRETHYRFQSYFQVICSVISILIVGGYWWLMGRLPSFLGFIFEANYFGRLLVPLASSGFLVAVIFIMGASIARVLANRYNDKYFRLHR